MKSGQQSVTNNKRIIYAKLRNVRYNLVLKMFNFDHKKEEMMTYPQFNKDVGIMKTDMDSTTIAIDLQVKHTTVIFAGSLVMTVGHVHDRRVQKVEVFDRWLWFHPKKDNQNRTTMATSWLRGRILRLKLINYKYV